MGSLRSTGVSDASWHMEVYIGLNFIWDNLLYEQKSLVFFFRTGSGRQFSTMAPRLICRHKAHPPFYSRPPVFRNLQMRLVAVPVALSTPF